MPIITLTNIEKTFGRKVVFQNLDFMLDRGERVGLIGDNGTGKTTLMRLFLGQVQPDVGTVSIAKSLKLGYLLQDPVFEANNTVMDEAELAFAELHDLAHLMRDLEHAMAHVVGDELDKILAKYQDAQHEFDLAGGYVWHHRVEAVLLGVGLDRGVWEQPVSTLSGGQRSRLALAKLLLGEPDILLLDEPTNHLDLGAIDWLEDLLDFSGAVLIISHDRYFLDRLSTRIVWLTGSKLKNYPGNYSSFVEQRKMQELAQGRAHQQQQADIRKQEEFIRRFGAGQRAREAKGREKRLVRLLRSDAIVQAVGTDRKIRVSLGTEQRAGDRVLTVRELSKSYGEKKLWRSISLEVKRGERIGIIGANGSGKTTLLEVLLGRRDADGGEVRWGANLNIGYYDQNLDDFDPENTVAQETRGDRTVTDQELRAMLAMMLFRNDDLDKPVGLLSGGERARIAMAQLLLDRPNVLVLDEPTNHLDIASREALESALGQMDGTILCVSHDRYFLDRTSSRLLILGESLIDFAGNYTAWQRKQAELARPAAPEPKSKPKPAPAKSSASKSSASKSAGGKSDNPWSRPFGRATVQELEKQINQTESALAECQQRFADPDLGKDASRAQKLKQEHNALAAKLKQMEEEYFLRGV